MKHFDKTHPANIYNVKHNVKLLIRLTQQTQSAQSLPAPMASYIAMGYNRSFNSIKIQAN